MTKKEWVRANNVTSAYGWVGPHMPGAPEGARECWVAVSHTTGDTPDQVRPTGYGYGRTRAEAERNLMDRVLSGRGLS